MITEERLSAFLDEALDAGQRQAVEVELEHDPSALRFVLEQRQLDRVLRSLLGAASRRERLKESILAALAGATAEQLRAQVLADTSGATLLGSPANTNTEAPPAPAPAPAERPSTASAKWSEPRAFIRTWIDELLGRIRASATARFAVAASVVLVGAVTWFITVSPRPAAGAEVGVLAAVVGYPELRRLGEDSPFSVQVGTPVRMGDRWETGDADRAEIRFRDGTTLRLAFNTTIDIRNPKSEIRNLKSPPVRPSEIHLLQGQIWTVVQTLTNAPEYSIRTDIATAVARGTEFGVRLQRVNLASPIPNAKSQIQNPQSPTGRQKSEVRSQKSEIADPQRRTSNVQRSTSNPGASNLLAVLTVKEGTVDFFNSFGSVQATAMTESTARADAAPTEPQRLETLQVVRLNDSTTWSLMTAALDWPEAAERLVGGGGSVGWQLRDVPGADGRSEVRISQLPSGSPAAQAALRIGDTIVAVDGQAATHARQVAGAILLGPNGAVNLRVRREAVESTFALAITAETNTLRGPGLSADTHAQLVDLLRQWLDDPLNPSSEATAERRRFEEVSALSRSNPVRAAAFNQLGVVFELEDTLGPAVRAYGRAVYLEPGIPLYRFNLGLALRKIGSFERALEEFEEAAHLEPDSVPARKYVAEVTSLLGRHQEALALTEGLLELAPQDHSLLEFKAQLLLKLQRPAEAMAPARMAAGLDPDCPVAHSYLAEAYHAAGRFAEAQAAWAEALDRAPFEPMFQMNLGVLQRDLEQSAAAEQSFRKAIELRPDFALAHRNLGEALADRHEFASAAAAFQRARELDPADAAAHWRFGDMALKQRQFDTAERAYRDAMEVAPGSVEAWYGLGEAFRLQRRPADAERAYRRAIELRSDHAGAHTMLGAVSYDRGEVGEAERLYRRAIELDPDEAAPYHNLGNLYREARGDLDTAEQWFRQALERASDDGEPLGGLGLVALDRGNVAEAERLLRRAVDLAPGSSALQNNLGLVLRQRGRADEAEPFYRRALELDPNNPAPYGNLGILQAERKEFDEAEITFRALLERSTGNARLPALVNLATVCSEQGKLDEAERLLRQALELAPDHPQVANSFASFLADHQLKLDEALSLATRALQSAPDDPGFLDTLGWVQAQRGDFDTAVRTLQRALALAGDEPPVEEIGKHLKQVLERMASRTTQTTPDSR